MRSNLTYNPPNPVTKDALDDAIFLLLEDVIELHELEAKVVNYQDFFDFVSDDATTLVTFRRDDSSVFNRDGCGGSRQEYQVYFRLKPEENTLADLTRIVDQFENTLTRNYNGQRTLELITTHLNFQTDTEINTVSFRNVEAQPINSRNYYTADLFIQFHYTLTLTS